jgi:hypothetical protein
LSCIQNYFRRDKITQLHNSLAQQQNIFKSSALQDAIFGYGEVIKECLKAVADVAFPGKEET